MKMHDDIKIGLNCFGRYKTPLGHCNHCSYYERHNKCLVWKICRDALAYIQQLEDHLREATKMMPKWISVEERLPEKGDVVLVIANGKPRENITLINAILIASYWKEEGWIADGFEGWDTLAVTHWMPLPEPPKEG